MKIMTVSDYFDSNGVTQERVNNNHKLKENEKYNEENYPKTETSFFYLQEKDSYKLTYFPIEKSRAS